jgi:hypothetical protein
MGDNQKGAIHTATEGGVIGKHAAVDSFQFLVGPSTSNEFNTARLRLIPIACFRIDDVRFKFDSSFVLPEVQADMSSFADLRKSDPRVDGAPISIFGHADPTFQGNFELGSSTAESGDDYNKTLSGRRSIAIYAMLIRDPSFWNTLFSNHLGADVWGEDSLKTILGALDQGGSSSPGGSSQNSSDSEKNARLRNIANDSAQRRQLFLQYMDLLCGDLKLDKSTDFLARGAGPDQKGDVQGCSRFNPLLLFSQEKEAEFKTADQNKDQAALATRNIDNAPNRRVMILIFRKGSQVLPAKWPCPTFKEGAAACKKRFFSDADARRSTHTPGADRKFDQTQDTFACRFYQRISDDSPCEQIIRPAHLIVNVLTPQGVGIEKATTIVKKLGTRDTDADGKADYGDVPPGTYKIFADKPGFGPLLETQAAKDTGDPGDGSPAKAETTRNAPPGSQTQVPLVLVRCNPTISIGRVIRGNPYVPQNASTAGGLFTGLPNDGMPDSVPPSKTYEVEVTVSNFSLACAGQHIDLTVANGSDDNGRATVAPTQIKGTTKVIVTGVAQTKPGHGGQLRIQAGVNGEVKAQSAGFSVCSHPINYKASRVKNAKGQDISDINRQGLGVGVGIRVLEDWDSDSGTFGDLGAVFLSEIVEQIPKTEPPFKQGSGFVNNSGYGVEPCGPGTGIQPANVKTFNCPGGNTVILVDSHQEPVPDAGPKGTAEKLQLHIYKCNRCGAVDKAMPNSGFDITHEVFQVGKQFKHRATKVGSEIGIAVKVAPTPGGNTKWRSKAGTATDCRSQNHDLP